MAAETTQRIRSGTGELGYGLLWLMICLAVAYGTYRAIASDSVVRVADRQEVDDPSRETGTAIQVEGARVTGRNAAGELAWELAAPNLSGGIAAASTVELPTFILYPAPGQTYTLRAARGVIAEAPDGERHTEGNLRLELEGPITVQNADASERFAADSGTWNGATQVLELSGAPLSAQRPGLAMQAGRLKVTFRATGRHLYEFAEGARVTGTRPSS